METKKFNVKDFFLNFGVIVALYTVVGTLVSLLFTVINHAYPKITEGYNLSQSISWPVASLIIVFPILIFLMWFLEREYKNNPEERNTGVHKLLTYITLFIAGVVMAGDLVTVLYYFLDGQELTTGFLLKVLVLLVISAGLFSYYLSDVRGTLTPKGRKIWRIISGLIVLGSIIWGFAVLGSPATQKMYKYDSQKITNLFDIRNALENHYGLNGSLPTSLESLDTSYYVTTTDSQTQKPYEYRKINDLEYELCADFNLASQDGRDSMYSKVYNNESWEHEAGRTCFTRKINPNIYSKAIPVR